MTLVYRRFQCISYSDKTLKVAGVREAVLKITFILKVCINSRNPTRLESACWFYYLQEGNSPIWLLGWNSYIFTNSILVVTRKNICQTGCSRWCRTHHCWVNKHVSLNPMETNGTSKPFVAFCLHKYGPTTQQVCERSSQRLKLQWCEM